MTQKLFVAGGSGFIGSPFMRLAVEAGYQVSSLCRSEKSAAAAQAIGATPVMGDLLLAGDWQNHAAQADIVVHVAQPMTFGGRVGKARALAYERDRLIMDRNLFDALHRANNLKRLVYCSGTSYYGQQDPPLKDESSAPNPRGWGKYIIKAMMQVERVRADGLPILLLFPSSVYGNGSWFAPLLETIHTEKVQLVLAGRDATFPLIHVEDCARAMLHLMVHGQLEERYILTDNQPARFSEILETAARALGKPLKTRPVPLWIAKVLAGPVVTDAYDGYLSNQRLLSTGFELKYPTLAQGIPAVVRDWHERKNLL
ncbi:MAG: TIGR01777 family oxidoreductase [Anaerolineae bacterium]